MLKNIQFKKPFQTVLQRIASLINFYFLLHAEIHFKLISLSIKNRNFVAQIKLITYGKNSCKV